MPREPWADVPDARRAVMRGNKAKDTKPEVTVRRMLHALGYRFQLHRRDLPGTPDIVFPGRQKAVQVQGCFWHQHEGCRHAVIPATRRGYWAPKLARNVQRDRQNAAKLRALGWRLAVVWECRLKANPGREVRRLRSFLERAQSAAQQHGSAMSPASPQEASRS